MTSYFFFALILMFYFESFLMFYMKSRSLVYLLTLLLSGLAMDTLRRNLVVVIDECISNDDVLATSGIEDNDFGNVIRGKRLDTTKKRFTRLACRVFIL